MGTDSENEIAALAEQLRTELRAEVRGEICQLRRELAQLRGNVSVPGAPGAPDTPGTPDAPGNPGTSSVSDAADAPDALDVTPVDASITDRVMSRRGALLFGTAAAVGAGLVVDAVGSAQPAAAAQGDPLQLGETNNDAGANDTALTSSAPDYSLQLTNSGAGQGLVAGDGGSGFGAGVVATLLNPANTSSALSGVTGGTGAGVSALSAGGYGVDASGLLAPLHLGPALAAGPPTTGDHVLGEIYVDANGRFYKSVGAGTPGTWVPLYSLVPLSTPIRLLDTRPGNTAAFAPGAPVRGPGTFIVQVTGLSVKGVEVPAGAVAVVGNVTAVDAVARGYLTLYPDGVPTPGTSSINFPVSTSVANGVTVALSAEGKLEIFASQTTDVVFDATGFVM